MKQFEGKNYTRLKEVKVGDVITTEPVEQTVIYAESQRERRDKIWKPPLKDGRRLARGRPQERLDFERKLRSAVRRVRKSGQKVTQGRVAEVFDPKKPKYSVRSLQKKTPHIRSAVG
jgi:hypothetical protein